MILNLSTSSLFCDIYNDNKTKILRRSLYELLQSDTSISFMYSMSVEDEKTDEEIISS